MGANYHVGRVPAGEIEAAVIDQMQAVFRQPEIMAGTWKAARRNTSGLVLKYRTGDCLVMAERYERRLPASRWFPLTVHLHRLKSSFSDQTEQAIVGAVTADRGGMAMETDINPLVPN